MESTNMYGTEFDSHRGTALDPTTPADVQHAVDEVASSIEQLYRVSNGYLGRQADERPYAVLGIAAGIGFVLGGGLASRLGGTLSTIGSKMFLSHMVDQWLSIDDG